MRHLTLFLLMATGSTLTGQNPLIRGVAVLDTSVLRYEKLEAVLDLEAAFDNPYDYDDIQIVAEFTAPDGRRFLVDGFYMQDYELDASTGALTPIGQEGKFKLRFSPDQVGTWSFQVQSTDRNGTTASGPYTFTCLPSSHPGFVRSDLSNYLQFDNGNQYIPIGENMAWQQQNAFRDYSDWLSSLSDNGGNFFRLWHAHWGLGIEWKSGRNDFLGLRRYKETNMRYQDWLFDFCAERGLYVMLCLQHHGQVSSQVNPNWRDSPYNTVNGGPAASTEQFFTHPEAKAHTRNRLRYVVARWGYSRAIMAWELFNEVDWTDNFRSRQHQIALWHAEMAAYLKSIDPYQHLVTTSYADENHDPLVWANPDIDLTQTHFYLNTSNLERAVATGIGNYLHEYGKPTLTGEFGLGNSSEPAEADPDGIHLHNALWAGLFSGGAGSAMSWWWDTYVHPNNLYYHFAPLARMTEEIAFYANDLRPADVYVAGAPGDLSLTPTLGWAGGGEDTITVTAAGQVQPENAGLSIYLYGMRWNTQHRAPPTFNAHYPTAGTFSVQTNTETGSSPRIAIYLNGSLVLDEAAATSQVFTIDVPAGEATITVDNTGRDWITIASYTFSGLGSRVDAYALRSQTQAAAAGWILNHRYNHLMLADSGEPEAVTGATLVLPELADGGYAVFWYDCLSGDLTQSDIAFAVQGELQAPIPPLYWDLAFWIESDPAVGTSVQQAPLAFQIYPNPAVVGGEITLQLPQNDSSAGSAQIILFDEQGKQIKTETVRSSHTIRLELPSSLSRGIYWLQVEQDGQRGSRPFVIGG